MKRPRVVPLLLLLAACGPGAEVKSGRELYLAYGCAACHGERGDGLGPAAGLSTFKPRDLRNHARFVGGKSEEAIATVIAFGIADGRTGMPAYPDIPRHERMEIARWILSLAGEPRGVTAHQAWAGTSNPEWKIAAAYLTLVNAGDAPRTLVGVTSPKAKSVEMHETVTEGEMMSMRQVEQIAIAPGTTVRLMPGATHLMLIDTEVREGDVVPLRLAFDDGSVVNVDAVGAKVEARAETNAPREGPSEPPRAIPEFTLTDHTGRPFRSASLRGRPALLFFGYTHCPDACPTMMSRVARAYREAGAKAHDVPTLFVSVDPRDTPAVLERYLAYFAAVPAKGLTGTKQQIDDVVGQFGARYVIRDSGSAAGPLVDHTLSLYLLDRDGKIAKKFGPESDPKEIAAALREQL